MAANKGYVDAQVNLGNIYYVGHGGVRQDYIQAFVWFALAADQGDEDAKRSLGEVNRKMTPTQIAEALKQKLLKKAAHGL